VISLRVTGNVLRRLHCFHPLVDIPQMCHTYVTFAEGCTVFQLSTSESVFISNGHTWMGTQSRHLARGGTLLNRPITSMKQHHSPGGDTIGYVRLGSPICSGIIIHCTFSILLRFRRCSVYQRSAVFSRIPSTLRITFRFSACHISDSPALDNPPQPYWQIAVINKNN